ncbi:hypothetical protein ABZ791_35925 [Streptomyces huasconensis]|uniref:Uncharacterized protein n=1 Tax=Streptomyces huasconensis TaxID=1854574 RepID=A0ABV3M650_9ACTN
MLVTLLGTLVTLGVTGGFGWIGDQISDDKPPIHVSGSRQPRAAVSAKPSPPGESPTPLPSQPAPGTPATGAPGASPEENSDQTAAEQQGIHSRPNAYICPWNAWVVNKPLQAFGSVPVDTKGDPDPRLISAKTAGDPDKTHLTIDIQSADARPLVIKKLRINVIKRRPAPHADAATLVGLKQGGCGGEQAEVKAHADLDGGASFASVELSAQTPLPQELLDGRTLTIDLTVETRTCDCTWVPEITWVKDGTAHRTEFRIRGDALRTIPSAGLQRLAWEQDPNTQKWSVTSFDETILDGTRKRGPSG